MGPAEGILAGNMRAQEAGWKKTALDSKALGPGLGPVHMPPPNPNEWGMEPTAKDYAFGGVGGTAATSERPYNNSYKVDRLSDDGLTQRGQKVSDKLAEAQSDRVFYNKMMDRNSNPSFREYYRAKAFEAGENATRYQRQLDAMGAPKRGLTNISDPSGSNKSSIMVE